jgi:hypothetical protein
LTVEVALIFRVGGRAPFAANPVVGTAMKFIERLLRLWTLSSPDTELISREEYNALMEHLTEQRREMKDMNDRISDWIGTLMKSELLRRELEGKAPQDDLAKSIH